MKKFVYYLLPPIAWASLIFFLSSQSKLPSPPDDVTNLIIKKLAHMLVFGILFMLTERALRKYKHKAQNMTSFCICLLYAVSDELHQRFTPGRTSHIQDVGFDTLGILIAILISKFTSSLQPASQPRSK